MFDNMSDYIYEKGWIKGFTEGFMESFIEAWQSPWEQNMRGTAEDHGQDEPKQCRVSEWARGFADGFAKGFVEEWTAVLRQNVKDVAESLACSVEEAMVLLDVPQERRPRMAGQAGTFSVSRAPRHVLREMSSGCGR